MQRLPIATSIGRIFGRDGLYLDQTVQSFQPARLTLEGDVNLRLCDSYSGDEEWRRFCLEFTNVRRLHLWHIDDYQSEKLIVSSFDEIQQNSDEEVKMFCVATYSWIVEVACKDYRFTTTTRTER